MWFWNVWCLYRYIVKLEAPKLGGVIHSCLLTRAKTQNTRSWRYIYYYLMVGGKTWLELKVCYISKGVQAGKLRFCTQYIIKVYKILINSSQYQSTLISSKFRFISLIIQTSVFWDVLYWLLFVIIWELAEKGIYWAVTLYNNILINHHLTATRRS